MTIFLILLPYGVFAMLMLAVSAAWSLFAAAAVCIAVIVLDISGGRSIKMLGLSSAILFGAVGSYAMFADSGLSNSTVKLAVDGGMFTISLISLAVRRPFTLQYAREIVDAETAGLPGFLHANDIITAAWAGAFLLMVIANVAMIYIPGLPIWSGLLVAFVARNSAAYFTTWYPRHRKAKHVSPSSSALAIH